MVIPWRPFANQFVLNQFVLVVAVAAVTRIRFAESS